MLRDRSAIVAYLGTPYRLRSNEHFYGGRHARAPWATLFWVAVAGSAALLAYTVIDKPAMGGWTPFAAAYRAGIVSEGEYLFIFGAMVLPIFPVAIVLLDACFTMLVMLGAWVVGSRDALDRVRPWASLIHEDFSHLADLVLTTSPNP